MAIATSAGIDRPGTRAKVRYVRMSASKARVVLKLIRGKRVTEAAEILGFTERLAAQPIGKCLASAVANAEHNEDLLADELFISACYAGSFVDGLSGPHSVIIASAAPDRTSFGCSNDRDLTYFGEAFYRDSLPGAASLRAAFDVAKVDVVAREVNAGKTPSSPVAFFGESIEQKLREIERAAAFSVSQVPTL